MDEKKIKKVLIDKGISQKELSEAVGVSATFLSQAIKGWKAPSLSLVKRIADFLEVSVDEII